MDDSGPESFDAFFRKHLIGELQHLVRQGFSEACAEEAVAESMANLYRRWDEIERPLAWVRRTARCHALDEVRSRQAQLTGGLERDIADLRYHDEDPVIGQEARARVVQLLAGLPVRRRTVISAWLDGFDDHEIAEELQISEATVRSHRRHGLREIAAKLGQEGGRP